MYDEDERIAPQAATTFVQREVDNVFMLSGGMVWSLVCCIVITTNMLTGLKVLYKIFPEGMLTGSVPRVCYPSPPPSARKSSKTTSVKSPPATAICTPPAVHKEEFTPEGDEHSHSLPHILQLYLLQTWRTFKLD